MIKLSSILISLLLLTTTSPAYSKNNDTPHISKKCSRYFSYFENKYKIPTKLLHSVSLIESGRWNKNTKQLLPWPWAVNKSGKSYFFKTKKEAVDSVKKMIDEGNSNIDIGCMQINLKYHNQAFKNLNHVFEPRHNIEYAATLLKKHYKRYTNWKNAVAAYHSASSLGDTYSRKVIALWQKQYALHNKEKIMWFILTMKNKI